MHWKNIISFIFGL